MDTYRPNDDYSQFSADQLRQAAQRVKTDMAITATIGKVRPEAVEKSQDLETFLLREAARRDGGR